MNSYCKRLQDLLAASGPAEIRDDERAQDHLVDCTDCFAFLETLGELEQHLNTLPLVDAPDEVVEALLARAEIAQGASEPLRTARKGWLDRLWPWLEKNRRPAPLVWATGAVLTVAVWAVFALNLTGHDPSDPLLPRSEPVVVKRYVPPPPKVERRQVAQQKLARRMREPDPTPDEPEPIREYETESPLPVGRVKVAVKKNVIDLESTETASRFAEDFVSDLPEPGRFYKNVLTMAPGVSDARKGDSPDVHGSRDRDFAAITGGVRNVDPLTGQFTGDDQVPPDVEYLMGTPELPPPSGPLLAGVEGVTLPVRVEGSAVQPTYPEIARVARVEGRVIAQVVIRRDGRVSDVEVLNCNRPGMGFEEATIEAVRRWRYKPARQGRHAVEVYYTVVVDFELSDDDNPGPAANEGVEFGRAQGGFANVLTTTSSDTAQQFLAERTAVEGLQFQSASGYWANTYVPGDPALRLLQSRLQRADRSKNLPTAEIDSLLHEGSRRPVQPFDPPTDSALAVYLNADRASLDQQGRMLVQVGLQGALRHGGSRPAMNLGIVLDLRGEVPVQVAASIRALLDALNEAKQPGDRFRVVIAGRPGAIVVEPDDFRHGYLAVTLESLLDDESQIEGVTLSLTKAAATAIREVAGSDDPSMPLGSSAVLLVTHRPFGRKTNLLTDMAHQSAVAGVPVSVVGIGDAVSLDQIDRVTLAGQGNRRLLGSASEAAGLIDRELEAASRVIARAVRLRIKLAAGVRLVNLIGSSRLGEPASQRVREAEQSLDLRLARNLGIETDRGEDEEGIQIVIPNFYAGDRHFILLDLVADGPGPVADVTARYKDLVFLRNGTTRTDLTLPAGNTTAGPLERGVLRSYLAQRLYETLDKAGLALVDGSPGDALELLTEFHDLLEGLRKIVPGFERDADLARDIGMVEEYREILENKQFVEGAQFSYLSDSLRYAARLKLLSPYTADRR